MGLRERRESQPPWRRYLRFWGPDVRADVEEELSFHVEMLVEEYMAAGMSAEAARRAARQRFGDYEAFEGECLRIGEESARMIRRSEWWHTIGQDLRYALRSLLNAPGFALATVLVLALGIGANTVVFSVLDAVLLRPLPYLEPDRLVQVFETFPLSGGRSSEGSVSYPNFEDWRERARSFEAMAISGWPGSVTLQGRGEAERLSVVPVGADLFRVLGAQPMVGRGFAAGEDEPGAAPVVVLSERAWRSRFGAERGILGTTLMLDGRAYTVIGIMPERFRFPAGREPVDVWVPLEINEGQRHARGSHAFMVLGRLQPGVQVAEAQREVERIAAAIEAEHPGPQEGRSAKVMPLREVVVGRVRPTLLVLMGAAGLVLMIAIANAASLLLARATSRRREVAIRSALGASRGRVVRQFLTESLALAVGGAVLGLLLAWAALRGIASTAAVLLPRATEVGLDLRVVGFLVGITLLTGIVFGLVPALQVSRTDPQEHLREGGRTESGGRAGQAFRGTLVVAQVSLSIVLLVGAGLLMRTFLSLMGTETGMRTENVLTVKTAPSGERYHEGAAGRFYGPVLERVRELPGVRAAGLINLLPLEEFGFNGNFGIAGKSYPSVAEQPFAEFRVVSPGYFAALGIPVVRGRDFSAQDGPDATRVAVINQALAERYFPGEDAVGQHLTGLGPDPVTIVGVVGSVRQVRLSEEPRAEVYFPLAQAPWGVGRALTLVTRTGVDPMSVARSVQAAIREIDPEVPVFDVRTMEQVVSESVSDRRLYLWLLGGFAAVAMALAIAGIYGVISYSVSQRTREFGIRLALGAEARRLRRMVVWQGGRLAVLGVLIGLPAAYALTRLLAALLYGVGAADPLTYAAVALVLSAVALAASYVPARRATRVDPVVALRAE